MSLNASDVTSLSKALSCWEYAEYIFATLVAVACAGEYVAEFTNWFTGGVKERKDRLAKRSTLLLVAALAFELVCLVRTNSLSEQLIGSLSDKAENADQKAQSAIDKSGIAESNATAAIGKGNEALDKVGAAKQAADRAKDEADILLRRAEELRKQVVALSPRNLTVEQQGQIAQSLKRVGGAHPTVIESYGMDGEGTALATQLIRTFEATGGGTPGDGRADKIVSGGFEWGISIRGPEYEMSYMTVLRDALVNIGRLEKASVNGPTTQATAQMSGRAAISGVAQIGGGGQLVRPPIPTSGPVYVLVGIRPPPVLPKSGKQ
ncbi:MAG: hypothetical protein DMG93_22520 [Acidobacteria bacterium]|nr:MAG: hypothetical protein DMG93_22520 [Acidobacteriota bacterium]